ncbi:hypothetical protein Moror_3393 [Moniliophthora roreri MCA 2997]|uniref:G protein-coupled receptor n=2 Tax=Moniliophthora roreri TaxID=221103 RepID=V2WZA0_MONRO|nr:hypothetical protein Moror_3393 [Moniliophthora roreri MCA 2997]
MVQVNIFEQSLYVAITLANIFFGMELLLAVSTIHLLVNHSQCTRKQKTFNTCFIIAILLTQAFALISHDAIGYYMWLEDRDLPEGPMAYHARSTKSWNTITGVAAIELTNLMSNSLLIYRCYIIWNSNILVIILPVIVYFFANAMAIMTLVESPGSSISSPHKSIQFLVLWIITTTSLNVLLTALISFPILSARRQLLKLNITPPNSHMGVIAILLETALPFPILGILSAILVAKGTGVCVIFVMLWSVYAGIAPLLIIYHAVKRTAHSNEDNETYSAMRFAVPMMEVVTTDSTSARVESLLPTAMPI